MRLRALHAPLYRSACALVVGLCAAHTAWAQASPPVSAGALLEQQRRQPPTPPPQAPDPGVLPALPARPAADDGSAAPAITQTTVRRFDVAGHTLLGDADVQAALAPWLNRAVGLPGLRQATSALEDAYRARGWLARVTLPAQDITDGTVRMAVTESRLGRVRLQQGTPALGAALTARVQAMLEHQLPAGQPLSLQALERALLLADELPGVRVQGSLQAGDSPGSTDVLVALSAGPLYRGEASVDNGGNRATGAERINAQVHLLSPLGLGEQLSLGASVSRGAQYPGLGATAPLPGAPGLKGWRMVGNASLLRYEVRDARNTLDTTEPQGPLVLVTPIRDASAQVTGLVQVRVSLAARRAAAYAIALPERTARLQRAAGGREMATQPDGQPLPAWLQFDAQSLAFTARAMPANALPLTVWLRTGRQLVEVEITEIP